MATRCPNCNSKSRYEVLISEYLNNMNIVFTEQYTNSILDRKSYDFAIFKDNYIIGLIEFDGEQHDKLKFGMSEEEFNLQQLSDKFKDNYALNNNIPLLKIKYKDRIKYKLLIDTFYTI